MFQWIIKYISIICFLTACNSHKLTCAPVFPLLIPRSLYAYNLQLPSFMERGIIQAIINRIAACEPYYLYYLFWCLGAWEY